MKKGRKTVNCPPGISPKYLNKVKKDLKWKKGDGGDAWAEVWSTAAIGWQALSEAQRKKYYMGTCWKKDGKLRDAYKPVRKNSGVTKTKSKKKTERKKKRAKIPIGHVGTRWIRKNCSPAEADALEAKGIRSANMTFVDDHCSSKSLKQAREYVKKKKRDFARRPLKSLGGCGCEACRRRLGGCACMSGQNCRLYYE